MLLTNNCLDDAESPHSSISNPKESDDSGIVDFVHLDTGKYPAQTSSLGESTVVLLFFYTYDTRKHSCSILRFCQRKTGASVAYNICGGYCAAYIT